MRGVVIGVKGPGPQLTSEINPKTEGQGPKREKQGVLRRTKRRSRSNRPLRTPLPARRTGHPAGGLVAVPKEGVCPRDCGIDRGEAGLRSPPTGGPSTASPPRAPCPPGGERAAGPWTGSGENPTGGGCLLPGNLAPQWSCFFTSAPQFKGETGTHNEVEMNL